MTVRQLIETLNIIVAADASAADLIVEFEEHDADLLSDFLVPVGVVHPRTVPDGSRRLVIARKA